MKIIALEEHYGLPVIYEAAHKAHCAWMTGKLEVVVVQKS